MQGVIPTPTTVPDLKLNGDCPQLAIVGGLSAAPLTSRLPGLCSFPSFGETEAPGHSLSVKQRCSPHFVCLSHWPSAWDWLHQETRTPMWGLPGAQRGSQVSGQRAGRSARQAGHADLQTPRFRAWLIILSSLLTPVFWAHSSNSAWPLTEELLEASRGVSPGLPRPFHTLSHGVFKCHQRAVASASIPTQASLSSDLASSYVINVLTSVYQILHSSRYNAGPSFLPRVSFPPGFAACCSPTA